MSEYSDDTDYYRLHELLTELGWPVSPSDTDLFSALSLPLICLCRRLLRRYVEELVIPSQ